ncbi:hypothetical protein AVEN_121765-1 [Araneus ventricosus]|uniref:Uncharacterized protein n=1 Tax=Araneus ventricosus TaxID=182803 RepID=A0A4Y2QZS7_ARAVE|nr:hypothetical protein AVEN_121765-1 [Araneus ventricosus]
MVRNCLMENLGLLHLRAKWFSVLRLKEEKILSAGPGRRKTGEDERNPAEAAKYCLSLNCYRFIDFKLFSCRRTPSISSSNSEKIDEGNLVCVLVAKYYANLGFNRLKRRLGFLCNAMKNKTEY